MRSLLFHNNINTGILSDLIFHPRSLIGSNSASLPKSDKSLKPERSTNTFGKFLQLSAAKNLSLENTIQKITSLPAKIFGIKKRGIIAEGAFADVVMLKNNTPLNLIINGQLAIQDGQLTNARNGYPL